MRHDGDRLHLSAGGRAAGRVRIRVAVVDAERHQVWVDLIVRPDTVEVWCGHHRAAVLDRAALRRWLAAGTAPLRVDEVTWTLMAGRVAFLVDDRVPCWPLPEHVVEDLRRRI